MMSYRKRQAQRPSGSSAGPVKSLTWDAQPGSASEAKQSATCRVRHKAYLQQRDLGGGVRSSVATFLRSSVIADSEGNLRGPKPPAASADTDQLAGPMPTCLPELAAIASTWQGIDVVDTELINPQRMVRRVSCMACMVEIVCEVEYPVGDHAPSPPFVSGGFGLLDPVTGSPNEAVITSLPMPALRIVHAHCGTTIHRRALCEMGFVSAREQEPVPSLPFDEQVLVFINGVPALGPPVSREGIAVVAVNGQPWCRESCGEGHEAFTRVSRARDGPLSTVVFDQGGFRDMRRQDYKRHVDRLLRGIPHDHEATGGQSSDGLSSTPMATALGHRRLTAADIAALDDDPNSPSRRSSKRRRLPLAPSLAPISHSGSCLSPMLEPLGRIDDDDDDATKDHRAKTGSQDDDDDNNENDAAERSNAAGSSKVSTAGASVGERLLSKRHTALCADTVSNALFGGCQVTIVGKTSTDDPDDHARWCVSGKSVLTSFPRRADLTADGPKGGAPSTAPESGADGKSNQLLPIPFLANRHALPAELEERYDVLLVENELSRRQGRRLRDWMTTGRLADTCPVALAWESALARSLKRRTRPPDSVKSEETAERPRRPPPRAAAATAAATDDDYMWTHGPHIRETTSSLKRHDDRSHNNGATTTRVKTKHHAAATSSSSKRLRPATASAGMEPPAVSSRGGGAIGIGDWYHGDVYQARRRTVSMAHRRAVCGDESVRTHAATCQAVFLREGASYATVVRHVARPVDKCEILDDSNTGAARPASLTTTRMQHT